MTPERVIQLLQVEKDYTLKQTGHSQQPINKEVRQALDIAIEAVKKQIPKKPTDFCGRHWGKAIGGKCPNCKREVNSKEYRYCRNCGQALSYDEVQENEM